MTSPAPGPRDHLITRALREALAGLDPELLVETALDPAEAPERLARHLLPEVRRALDDEESADAQAARVNSLLGEALGGEDEANDAEVELPARILQGVKGRSSLGDVVPLPAPPATPLGQSDLLVNAQGQPNIGSELRREIASADSVDLICAFVIWSGVRHLREALAELVARGGRLRVITTTYMGATEKKAVDELVALGADVRVALDARTTKLHAKAWLLERSSGLTTAFVGSSNLSHSALFDGLEWNVRLSAVDAAHVIDRVRMTFASHWESEHFEPYDPERNGEELERALEQHERRSVGADSTISFANLDVRPYPHQHEVAELGQQSAEGAVLVLVAGTRESPAHEGGGRVDLDELATAGAVDLLVLRPAVEQCGTPHRGHSEPVGRNAQRSTGLHRDPVGGPEAERLAQSLRGIVVMGRPRLSSAVCRYRVDEFAGPTERGVDRHLLLTLGQGKQLPVVAAMVKLGCQPSIFGGQHAGTRLPRLRRQVDAKHAHEPSPYERCCRRSWATVCASGVRNGGQSYQPPSSTTTFARRSSQARPPATKLAGFPAGTVAMRSGTRIGRGSASSSYSRNGASKAVRRSSARHVPASKSSVPRICRRQSSTGAPAIRYASLAAPQRKPTALLTAS